MLTFTRQSGELLLEDTRQIEKLLVCGEMASGSLNYCGSEHIVNFSTRH